ncbi:PilZ domain-containing protein [Neptunicella sp. SCSIO 80796]|uniref:PilZ domain-containing protein n=1 Tax=Neptunicella plasticusilytica TaxID=3117012 RepID=UPI003A4D84FB
MDKLSLQQKQQQFHEFFTIKHPVKVNMKPLDGDFVLPDQQDLTEHMPYEFRVACEVSSIEANALRPLRNLGEQAVDLVNFLKMQSRKIDLIMSIVLQQQDDETHRYTTLEFGGGGIKLVCNSPLEIESQAELKLFLTEEAAAVFCYAEVIACQAVDEQYHISLIFTRIREEDQELLVRASLHLQTQQLKKRRHT